MSPASPEATWISDEPRFSSVARRILSRGLRRPAKLVGIALLVTSAALAWRAAKRPVHEASMYFLLEEGEVTEPRGAPPPPRDIGQYIASVALSGEQLERIMRKHHISEARLARDRAAAIAEFREGIEIHVERNYFIYERSWDDPPRSAQVTISMMGADEEKTTAVLHDVADAILGAQATGRMKAMQQTRDIFARQLEILRARRRALTETIGSLAVQAASADPERAIAARSRSTALETELQGLAASEAALERRAADLTFSVSAETAELGTRFELMDERLVTFGGLLTPTEVALRAAAVFGIALLVMALAVGAFDDRIHSPEDVAWWGLPLFGALSRFEGDDAGSHRARARRLGRRR